MTLPLLAFLGSIAYFPFYTQTPLLTPEHWPNLAPSLPRLTPPPLRMCSVSWEVILEARQRHHEVKLEIAEAARQQKGSETLGEYQRLDAKLAELFLRDDEEKLRIARMIGEYFGERAKNHTK